MISLESIVGFLSKALAGVARKGIEWGIRKFKRPKIVLCRAPENIFSHLAPGASVARARELLGAPHREHQGELSYAFLDALVQLKTEDGVTIVSIAIALPQPDTRSTFPIYPTNYVLGKVTMADVLQHEGTIVRDSSTKHWAFFVREFYGFSGFYRHFVFGVVEAPPIRPPVFEWDHEMDALKSDPKKVRINWVMVSSYDEKAPYFNFWAFT